MRRSSITHSILILYYIIAAVCLHARTRDDIIIESSRYIDKQWTCHPENLYDNYLNESFEQRVTDNEYKIENYKNYPIKPDGKDDRRGKNDDPAWWPYVSGQGCEGVAYAYGGLDSPLSFENRINTIAVKNYVAGSRATDYNGIDKNPINYAGYAGVDCSGFVMRLVVGADVNIALKNKWNVGDWIRYYLVQKDPKDLKKGDVLVYLGAKGNHVVVLGGGTPGREIEIRQATPLTYRNGTHVRKVIKENINSAVVGSDLVMPTVLKDGTTSTRHHIPLTPFPLFTSEYPKDKSTIKVSESNRQSIPIRVYVASRMGLKLLEMRVDGIDVTGNVSIKNYDSIYELRYVPNPVLTDGEHTVEVSVENDYHLVDDEPKSFKFYIKTEIDSDNDGMPDDWEDEYGSLDPDLDADGDLLTNLQEYLNGTNPLEPNTDKDPKKITDKDEVVNGTDPNNSKDDDGYKAPVEKPKKQLPDPGKKYTYESGGSVTQNTLVSKDPNMMTGPDGQVSPGQTLTYTVEFENIGDGIAYGVYVADILGEHYDDSSVLVSNCKRIDYNSGSETPAQFEYRYNPDTRTVTVFIDNEGELGSKQGGKYDITVRLKSSIVPGTVITNYATVYFPSAPETTNTNTVASVVPLSTSLQYTGNTVFEYSDNFELSAIMRDANGRNISGKTIIFEINGSTYNAITGDGIASRIINDVNIEPGEYSIAARFDNDGFAYLGANSQSIIIIAKKCTKIMSPGTVINEYPATSSLTVTLTDNDEVELLHQTDEPKMVYLDYFVDGSWQNISSALLVKSTATFEFSLSQKPNKTSYPLRARFDGDSRYKSTDAEGVLRIVDTYPPEIVISSPIAGERFFAAISSVTINFAVQDLDPAPTTYAYLSDLEEGTTIQVTNGQVIDPLSIDDGFWNLTVNAVDWIGFTASTATGSFEVVHDYMPPTVRIDALPQITNISTHTITGQYDSLHIDTITVTKGFVTIDANTNTFSGTIVIEEGFNLITVMARNVSGSIGVSTAGITLDTVEPVTAISVIEHNMALSATDETSGVAQTLYRLDSGAWQIYMDTVTVSAASQNIDYYSTDKAGNSEAVKNYHFTVNADTVAPVTEFGVINPAGQTVFQGVTYVNGRAQFKLSAFDPEVNGISSGMKEMNYKTDSGDWVTLAEFDKTLSFDALSDGQHSVSYKAEDNAGNVSAAGVYTAVFDKTRPAVAGTFPQDGGRFNPKKHAAVIITFSEPVKCANWEDNIQITESKGRRLKGFEVKYDSNTYTVLITANFKHNSVYKVTVKNGITDLVNNGLNQYKFTFSTLVSAREGCTYEDEDTGLVIVALPGVLPCDGYFEVQLLDNICLPRIPKPFEWLFGGRKAYLILYRDEHGSIVEEQVKKAFKLVVILRNKWVSFAPSSPEGPKPPDVKNMKLYHVGSVKDAAELSIRRKSAPSALADLSKGSIPKPKPVPLQEANDITQEVSAEVNEFGMFTLAGFMAPSASLDDLSCYPSPFDPNSRPVTIQYYLINAANTEIAIYDIMGNLVKAWEITSGDTGAQGGLNQLLWDGRNGQGDMVANGGYIVCVSGDGKTKKFKFMVVK